MASRTKNRYVSNLTAIDEKLTSIARLNKRTEMLSSWLEAALDSRETYKSRRYSEAGGVYKYYIEYQTKDTHDDLSKIVAGGGSGYIHIDNGPEPRLLCEHMHRNVVKKELIRAAVSFFYPELTDVVDAFNGGFTAGEYCMQAKDQYKYTVFIVFEFEDVPVSSYYNLILLMKRQFRAQDIDLEWLYTNLQTKFSAVSEDNSTSNRCSHKAAELVRTKIKDNRLEYVKVIACTYDEERNTENKSTELLNTKYIQLVIKGNGMPHVWGHNTSAWEQILCERVAIPRQEGGEFDHSAMGDFIKAAITNYHPDYTATERFFNMNERPGDYCWQCKQGDITLLLFFKIDVVDSKFSLTLIGTCERRRIDANRLKQLVDTIRADTSGYDQGNPQPSFAEVAHDCMQILHAAVGDGLILERDVNSANVIGMSVPGYHNKQLMLEDAFVKAVHEYNGVIGSGHDNGLLIICYETDRRADAVGRLIKTSIPHLFPHERFTNIEVAYEGHPNILKALDYEHHDWIFIFTPYFNSETNDNGIILKKYAMLQPGQLPALLERTQSLQSSQGTGADPNAFENLMSDVLDS